MKVMFMGTPDIAVPCLEALTENHDVVCAVTQPDRPKNRGHKLAMPPVKEFALSRGIDVLQPASFKDMSFAGELEKYSPDVIVVIAYGRILPEYILNFPKFGCINVHASLLPKYRGAAPIQWAVANGETVTGVTTMLMEKGLDTGDMLLKREVEITPEMTGGELYTKLSEICPAVLLDTLDSLENIVPEKQDDSKSSYAPMINKAAVTIDWNKSAEEIVNLIRAMNPSPAARTFLNGKLLKVFSALKGEISGDKGTVLSLEKGITVGCRDGSVVITEVQPEGKKRMSSEAYLMGNRTEIGAKLI